MHIDDAGAARFRDIYERHFEAVRRYAWRRDPAGADDVTAETFLVAWRRLDQVPDDALPWLLGVARKVRQNEGRRAGRQVAVRDRLARESSADQMYTDTEVAADGFPTESVASALTSLPERDREILLLSVWEDLDRAAIASALGCSEASVSVRLHRARRRFAKEFARQSPVPSRFRPSTLQGGSDVR